MPLSYPIPGPRGDAGAEGPAGPLQFTFRLGTTVNSLAKQNYAVVTSPITVTRAFLASEVTHSPSDVAWSWVEFQLYDGGESSPQQIAYRTTRVTGGSGFVEVTTPFFEGGSNPQPLGLVGAPFSISPDGLTPSVITIQMGVGAGIGAPLPKGLYVFEYTLASP